MTNASPLPAPSAPADGPGVRAATGAHADAPVAGLAQQATAAGQPDGVTGQIAGQLAAQGALRGPVHPGAGWRAMAHQLQQCAGVLGGPGARLHSLLAQMTAC